MTIENENAKNFFDPIFKNVCYLNWIQVIGILWSLIPGERKTLQRYSETKKFTVFDFPKYV